MPTISYIDEERSPRSDVRCARLFIALSCADPRDAMRMEQWASRAIDLHGVNEVSVGRSDDELRCSRGGAIVLLSIPDGRVSLLHLQLMRKRDEQTGGDCWELIDRDSKNGTWLNGTSVSVATLKDNDVIELGTTILLFREDSRGYRPAHAGAIDERSTLHADMAEAISHLHAFAPSAVSLLLHGETGTGKEVMARLVHRLSGRQGPFVAVNCAAIPESLIVSELFGVRRGAYSGADENRPGLVRSADGGTLFLDEIAELPMSCQGSLLRVLQEQQVTPVGGTAPVSVDMRVLTATHQDLDQRVDEGRFRADLLARIRGYAITLPPLRDRREDIGLLIALLSTRLRERELRFSRRAGAQLFMYHWPHNVRELVKALDASSQLARGGKICLEHLPDVIAHASPRRKHMTANEDAARERQLRALTERYNGNVSAIARAMDTSRSHVRRLLNRFGIGDKR